MSITWLKIEVAKISREHKRTLTDPAEDAGKYQQEIKKSRMALTTYL